MFMVVVMSACLRNHCFALLFGKSLGRTTTNPVVHFQQCCLIRPPASPLLWPDGDTELANAIGQRGAFHPEANGRAFRAARYPVRLAQRTQHMLALHLL